MASESQGVLPPLIFPVVRFSHQLCHSNQTKVNPFSSFSTFLLPHVHSKFASSPHARCPDQAHPQLTADFLIHSTHSYIVAHYTSSVFTRFHWLAGLLAPFHHHHAQRHLSLLLSGICHSLLSCRPLRTSRDLPYLARHGSRYHDCILDCTAASTSQ
jgi:hypothetical protein